MFEWLLSDQMVGNMLYVNSLLLMGGSTPSCVWA